jgi:biotin transporter BioY
MGRLGNMKHDWLQKHIRKIMVWIMERLLHQFSVIHLLGYPWQWLLNNIKHINVTTAFLYGNLAFIVHAITHVIFYVSVLFVLL